MKGLVAAGEALGTARHRVLSGLETRDIHRNSPFVNKRGFLQHQPLGDLGGGESVYRIQDGGFCGAGLEGGALSGEVAQEGVDLLVAAQSIGQASPAGSSLRRTEDGTEERLDSLGSYQHPGDAGGKMAPIELGVPLCEIVIADDDVESRVVRVHLGTHRFQPPGEVAVVTVDGHRRRGQPLLRPARRSTERGPVRRPTPLHRVRARDDVSPGREGGQRRPHVGCRIPPVQGRDDVVVRALAVEQRQEVAMDPPAQQRVEGLGDQKRLVVADQPDLQMRRQHRQCDRDPVGSSGPLQYPVLRDGGRRAHVNGDGRRPPPPSPPRR